MQNSLEKTLIQNNNNNLTNLSMHIYLKYLSVNTFYEECLHKVFSAQEVETIFSGGNPGVF